MCPAKLFENEPQYFKKEVHYFDTQARFLQGTEFYAKRFEDCYNAGEQFAMDATPNTLYYAKEVYETYMEAGGNQAAKLKMILILRDPASRELSLYNHKKHDYARTQDQNQWYSNILSKEDGSIMGFDKYVQDVVKPLYSKKDLRSRIHRQT